MSAELRFNFYRTLSLQMQGGVSLKDSLSLMVITGHNPTVLKAVSVILDSVNREKLYPED